MARLIGDILFPRVCVRCGREGEDACASCLSVARGAGVSLTCPACGEPSVIGALHAGCSSSLDGLLFALPYREEVAKGLIKRWKFDGVRSVEPHLRRLIEMMPISDILEGDDWIVVPIPLHARRKRERGFDQAAWIAKTVADLLHLPAADLLERTRYTTQQSRQEKRSKEDLLGVFRARQPIQDRVILCDDVFTSGATMEAAAKACRQSGATSVWGVVIAKG